MQRFLFLFALTLSLAACTAYPLTPSPESTAAPRPDVTPASEAELTPNDIWLDTQGLPYTWQANLIAGTGYDLSTPPGPKGLPEHIQINFGVVKPQDRQPGDPILYIIPMEDYTRLWEAQAYSTISRLLSRITALTQAMPETVPHSGLPILPVEEVGGVNDLAVQIRSIGNDDHHGFRFVGRFAQDATPLTNNGLFYIYQGLSNDQRYLVTCFYPITTSALPDITSVTKEEQASVANDPQAYLRDKAALLEALEDSAWEPNLGRLDALVVSLTFTH